jgi:hypothetical protein
MTPEALAAQLRQRLADEGRVPLKTSRAVPDDEVISSFAMFSDSQQGWAVSQGLLPYLVAQSRDAEHFLALLTSYEEPDHWCN